MSKEQIPPLKTRTIDFFMKRYEKFKESSPDSEYYQNYLAVFKAWAEYKEDSLSSDDVTQQLKSINKFIYDKPEACSAGTIALFQVWVFTRDIDRQQNVWHHYVDNPTIDDELNQLQPNVESIESNPFFVLHQQIIGGKRCFGLFAHADRQIFVDFIVSLASCSNNYDRWRKIINHDNEAWKDDNARETMVNLKSELLPFRLFHICWDQYVKLQLHSIVHDAQRTKSEKQLLNALEATPLYQSLIEGNTERAQPSYLG